MINENNNYMQDSHGRLVPVTMISDVDKLRHDLVHEIAQSAQVFSRNLAELKKTCMGNIRAFLDLSLEKYQVKWGGSRGNVTLISFDGTRKIQIAVSERISFDERLQAAKKLIDECITNWAQGSCDEIRALINDAFQVDKTGKIDTQRVLGLRRLDIHDQKWTLAMLAIIESVQIMGSKEYLRIYTRENAADKWEQIILDFSAI